MVASKLQKKYVSAARELHKKGEAKLTGPQRKELKHDIKNHNGQKLKGEELTIHKKQFTQNKKNALKSEWEKNTGQKWPQGKEFDTHHIIPQQLGGKHEWWNIFPVHLKNHRGGIHGSGSALRNLIKFLEELGKIK